MSRKKTMDGDTLDASKRRGTVMRMLRERLFLDPGEVAMRMGVEKDTYCRFESGKRFVDVDEFERFAGALTTLLGVQVLPWHLHALAAPGDDELETPLLLSADTRKAVWDRFLEVAAARLKESPVPGAPS